jgi:hypothetical protein
LSAALLLSWREGVTASAEGTLVVQGSGARVTLRQVPVLGGGDADLFARAADTDYYAETSVGEFLLGNPRPPSVGRVG